MKAFIFSSRARSQVPYYCQQLHGPDRPGPARVRINTPAGAARIVIHPHAAAAFSNRPLTALSNVVTISVPMRVKSDAILPYRLRFMTIKAFSCYSSERQHCAPTCGGGAARLPLRRQVCNNDSTLYHRIVRACAAIKSSKCVRDPIADSLFHHPFPSPLTHFSTINPLALQHPTPTQRTDILFLAKKGNALVAPLEDDNHRILFKRVRPQKAAKVAPRDLHLERPLITGVIWGRSGRTGGPRPRPRANPDEIFSMPTVQLLRDPVNSFENNFCKG
ncbi:hypothetical protein EVAR_38269_1 [Eumeta japonica]|uniref:Uncharacterized protein n=1 Tax=Eumeta variegata TaxID=151549 RepID=A0A4C1W9E9_EUMVA|nr:hypothetical protein EVAR_38269_1 [Eumeta japonica]